MLAGDPAALRFLDLVDISLDPLDEGRRMWTLTNRTDMHGVEMLHTWLPFPTLSTPVCTGTSTVRSQRMTMN